MSRSESFTVTAVDQMAATLSDYVYRLTTGLPPGVKQMPLHDLLKQHNVSQSHIEAANRTSYSSLFSWDVNTTGDKKQIWFFVNRGTCSKDDWVHNLLQLAGESHHFMDTALVAYEVSKIARKHKIELIFCGHSKGGTHASLHSFITSHKAITFNSPGVSQLTKCNVAKKLKLDETSLNHHQTISFVTDMDVVTSFSRTLSENREEIISCANRIHPKVKFDSEKFGIVPPDGQLQLLDSESTSPALEVILVSIFTAVMKDSMQAGIDKFSDQLHEKHSMQYVLKRINSLLDKKPSMKPIPSSVTVP